MAVELRSSPRHLNLARTVGIVAGLTLAGLGVPLVTGDSTLNEFYRAAWTGSLGSTLGIGSFLAILVPLLIGGLGATIPYRLGFFNVGIPGQILIGAWAATGVAFLWSSAPGPVLIPLMMLASCIGGAVWIAIPALCRVYLGVSEIITTFLLNFVAVSWVAYWLSGPWYAPRGTGLQARPLPEASNLPVWDVQGVPVHLGIGFAIILLLVAWIVLRFTRTGYEMGVIGASDKSGRYAGLNVKKYQVYSLLIGGALGGLAGTVDMLGSIHQLSPGLPDQIGFNAIVVAVLGGGGIIGLILLALLISALLGGGNAVSIIGVPAAAALVIVGTTLAGGAVGEAWARIRVVIRKPTIAGVRQPSSEGSVQRAEEVK